MLLARVSKKLTLCLCCDTAENDGEGVSEVHAKYPGLPSRYHMPARHALKLERAGSQLKICV